MDRYVYGHQAVETLLQQRPTNIKAIYIKSGSRGTRLKSIIELAHKHGIQVADCTKQQLEQMVAGRHQGVVALVVSDSTTQQPSLAELLDQKQSAPLLLLLDQVTDPHNLGACLRTAEVAGVDAVIAPKRQSVGLTPAVYKTACGAAELMPFYQVTNLARTMRWLQQREIWVLGLDERAEASLYQCDLTSPTALVLGAEDQGLRRLTRDHCDQLIAIPTQGRIHSLNVSVACGVSVFEALRQRLY